MLRGVHTNTGLRILGRARQQGLPDVHIHTHPSPGKIRHGVSCARVLLDDFLKESPAFLARTFTGATGLFLATTVEDVELITQPCPLAAQTRYTIIPSHQPHFVQFGSVLFEYNDRI